MKKIPTRRIFIASIILTGTALTLLPQGARTPIRIEPYKVIEAVQETLFPEGLEAPSALEFGATNYLATVSTHSSFWADDLKFLAYGAELLMMKEHDFLSMNAKSRDEALRDFVSDSPKGKNWVSLILFYTIEALLSDPIYEGNRENLGWKWLNHNTGQPQPKKLFGELV